MVKRMLIFAVVAFIIMVLIFTGAVIYTAPDEYYTTADGRKVTLTQGIKEKLK
jgi:hypothetical protein